MMRLKSELEREVVADGFNLNEAYRSRLVNNTDKTSTSKDSDVPIAGTKHLVKKSIKSSQAVPLKTKRREARYGNKIVIGGQPFLEVKAGSKTDYVTPEEFLQDMFDKPVEAIVFTDGQILTQGSRQSQ